MPRRRPDPVAAGARLAGFVPPQPVGGWVPPPVIEPWQPVRGAVPAVDEAPTLTFAAPAAGTDCSPPEPTASDRSWAPRSDPPPAAARLLTGFVPAGLRGGRWDPGRRGLAALAAVAVLAVVIAGFVLLRGRPHEVAPPPIVAVSAGPAAGGPEVVIDVGGKVRHPGIVHLPLGARVDDAVRAAGGALPGASFDGLNRARKLSDGEQVLVGIQSAAGSSGPGADGRIDINAADAAAFDVLPGIGPVLAQKIVDWRTEHGRFASVDQLREVGGIGESKFAALKNKVRT